MKGRRQLQTVSLMLTAIIFALSFNAAGANSQTQAAKKAFVCPPCDCGNDGSVYEHPGGCPSCSMALIEKNGASAEPASQAPRPPRKKAAILIFDGVQIIDYTGPFEVFGQAGVDVFTVSASTNPITTSMGMRVIPKFTFENAPQADILLIPGGEVRATYENPAVIQWIQEKSKVAEHVVSVCNGAYILARTGFLDGLSATTYYGLLDGFVPFAPKTRVVRDQRYVDNGKFITTAGLSSGIDGSLYVVAKIFGKARAQMVALNLEYNWQADSSYARASFADLHLHKIFSRGLVFETPKEVTLKVISTEGSYDRWEIVWQTEGKTTVKEVAGLLQERLANARWNRINDKSVRQAGQSVWRFTDEKGSLWNALVAIKPLEKTDTQFQINLKINNSRKTEAASAVSAKSGGGLKK